MKRLLICLFCFLCCFANAQNNKVTIRIDYLDKNPALANSVGNTLSNLFTEFDLAYTNSTQPNIRNLNISENTKSKILSLWTRQKFRLPGKSVTLGVAKLYGTTEYAVFSVPLQAEGVSNCVDYTIQFNSNGLITNFERSPFSLSQLKFATGNRTIDAQTKNIINVMLYQLSNAYATKDVEYLRKIYDPNGYCITGTKSNSNVSTVSAANERRVQLDKDYYDLTIKKLSEYVDDLENKVFKYNAWVKPIFGTPEITAHQNPDAEYDGIYYINVFQNYQSQHYNDKGWLTLVVNLRNQSNPLILARVWLPNKITNEQLTSILF